VCEDEARYHRYYCDVISLRITGDFRSSLWRQLIPQAGEVEPSIKHAIIALGALSKSTNNPGASWDPHHEYALIQYDKALKSMRAAMRGQDRNYRNILMSCILVFCFESQEGHLASASAHASSAVSLLFQCAVDQGGHKSRRHPSHCAQRFSIEEDLHAAFSNLDLQALLLLDNRPAHLHRELVEGMTAAVNEMPTEFVDLKDCRAFLQVIMRRNFHFISASTLQIQDQELKVDSRSQTVAEFHPRDNVGSKLVSALPTSRNVPMALKEQRDRYMADICQWKCASDHLFQRIALSENGVQNFVSVNLLKIHAAMNTVLLSHTFSRETEYDVYLPEFRLITELSTTIYPYLISPTSLMYRFDLGIIAALFQVGVHCRNSETRHQAVDLMLRSPGYREGIWDATFLGKVSEAAMQIEEEWMDEGGCIPGNRRASLLKGDCWLSERRAVQVFGQRIGTDRENEIIEREIELRW
jgi:hypothetical protein